MNDMQLQKLNRQTICFVSEQWVSEAKHWHRLQQLPMSNSRTKRIEDEVGTFIHIIGSEVKKQEPTGCNNGTGFMIKNLFFNVPARRKFLKGNTTEIKHIIWEIQRIAIPNPEY